MIDKTGHLATSAYMCLFSIWGELMYIMYAAIVLLFVWRLTLKFIIYVHTTYYIILNFYYIIYQDWIGMQKPIKELIVLNVDFTLFEPVNLKVC